MSSFVTHLESAIDGTHLRADVPQTIHAGRPLWVRYDLEAVGRALSRDMLKDREPTLWRYRELLPPDDDDAIVSLGEGLSPLLPCRRLGQRFGLHDVWIKDESRLPTGSFKSRGLAMAISMCRQFGIRRVAIPTAGNAGGATAAYAARAGIEAFVFMPDDTPTINQYECHLAGAHTFLVDGLITDCGRLVREGKELMQWFDLSTLREPYRIEGKKTMGLELAEQFNWRLPDVILYPTGGGTGLIGMWKAFEELAQLGWLEDDRRPRMVAVQSAGCAPIVRAFEAGQKHAEPFPNAATVASGIRVPAAIGDFMILDAVRSSEGRAIAVEEEHLMQAMRMANATEGISVCPEAGACVAALEKLSAEGWIQPRESVVIFNTGAAQKYPEAIAASLPRIQKDQPLDPAMLLGVDG
jgi:threonine synthase